MINIVDVCEQCGSEDLEFLDALSYRCSNCGYVSHYEDEDDYEDDDIWDETEDDFEEYEEDKGIEEEFQINREDNIEDTFISEW